MKCTRRSHKESKSHSHILVFFLLLINDQIPVDGIVHLVDGRGPASVQHKSHLTVVELIYLHSNIELMVYFQGHVAEIWNLER